MVAAAYVHTIKKWGPDRVAGFSPIPAMSMVSHASGARFTSLIGGSMLCFYDWYADLPVASPQVFGDQTDVPESGDWWDAGYLIMWGSNVPVTRTPDAHWMTEARYRGQKVVVVSPDYADNVKFADEWLAIKPGTDGALAMAMGHVVLKEFFVDRQTPYFADYTKKYTDLPYLVALEAAADGAIPGREVPHRRRPARARRRGERPLQDRAARRPHRRAGGAQRLARPPVRRRRRRDSWNLDLGDVDPRLTLLEPGAETVLVELPRFDNVDGTPGSLPREVPVRRVGDTLVTTVFDLMLAQYGVGRDGLGGDYATSYDDATAPYTPAWQEPITGVPAAAAARIAREFAANAEESRGRSMILMGAGTNHWFHSDTIYRGFLALTTLTGCQGVNGGGWAHYVGQEKCRPVTGWAQLAFGLDWKRPPRQMIHTAYWYLHTDQFRYDTFGADTVSADDRQREAGRDEHRRRDREERPDGLDAVVPDLRPQPARPRRRGGRGRPAGRRARRRPAEVRATCASPRRTRTPRRTSRASSRSGGPTCSARRARATSTSSSTCSAPTARCARPRRARASGRRRSTGTRRRPRGSSTCC